MILRQAIFTLWALLGANVVCLANADIWLTAAANTNAWPGSSNAPYYAGNAAAFTAILATNNANCTFHYAPGLYQTVGWSFNHQITANPGCKHFGSGIGQTIIQLVGVQPNNAGIIFATDRQSLTDGFEVHDMTLDCNAVNNPTYASGSNSCHAVNLAGNNILLSNLMVIGFGTAGKTTECFPVYLGPLYPPLGTQTNIQNVIVENCIFTSPAPTNACAVGCCTVGGYTGYNLVNNVIQNCSASNLVGHFPAAPHSFYAPVVQNCLADACGMGFYCEPGFQDEAHRDWMVRSNVFRNVDYGVFINYYPGQRIKSLTFEGNQIQLKCTPSAGFSYYAPTIPQGEGIDWLVFRNNTIYDPGCTNGGNTGARLGRATQLVMQSNQVSISGVALVLDSSTVTNSWFAGNVNGAGAPLLITNWFRGIMTSQTAATVWTNVTPPPVSARIQTGP
jgi:hypothetical protein